MLMNKGKKKIQIYTIYTIYTILFITLPVMFWDIDSIAVYCDKK